MTDTLRILTGYGSIDLLNPTLEDVNMRDVVINLSRIRRWNGAIDFTVGQHSLLVEAILKAKGCNQATCLAGLLHDAHEYATGDIAGPMLERLQITGLRFTSPLSIFQIGIQTAIHIKVDVSFPKADARAINAADMEARAAEIHWLLPESALRAELMVKYPEPGEETRQAFLKAQGANLDTLVGLLRFYGVSV